MAHFAQIDAGGLVQRVVKLDDAYAPDPAPSNEAMGQQRMDDLSLLDSSFAGTWIQTSYLGSFRKQFAGLGFTYDPVADVFIAPQPFPSWSLDANHDWQPPTPMPQQGDWAWDEDTLSWVEVAPQ